MPSGGQSHTRPSSEWLWDLGLLAQTGAAAKGALGVETIQAVADRSYYKGEDIQACEDVGIKAYVARPQRGSAMHDGLFRKEEFTFDAEADAYMCPENHVLQPLYRSTDNGVDRRHYVNRRACRDCTLRPQCTSGTFRKITRWTGEAVLDWMEARLGQPRASPPRFGRRPAHSYTARTAPVAFHITGHGRMTRAAAQVTEAADALLDWLNMQAPRTGPAGPALARRQTQGFRRGMARGPSSSRPPSVTRSPALTCSNRQARGGLNRPVSRLPSCGCPTRTGCTID